MMTPYDEAMIPQETSRAHSAAARSHRTKHIEEYRCFVFALLTVTFLGLIMLLSSILFNAVFLLIFHTLPHPYGLPKTERLSR
jgi:hypothetical protein